MKVLMFGWEFPPHIAGGLGTACYGIVKGLAYNGVETIFVMPSASGDEEKVADIVNASEVPVEMTDTMNVDEFLDKSSSCISEPIWCLTWTLRNFMTSWKLKERDR